MKTLFFKTLPSTQLYLKELLKNKKIGLPLAIVSEVQTNGVGSRNNSWISKEGNLFLSFAIPLETMPIDLKLESASIYYSYLLKETLEDLGSKVSLKWPNDLYLDECKIGGMLTNIIDNALVCGVGINLQITDNIFGCLDIDINKNKLIELYFKNIEKRVLWKQVFSKYKLHFQTNQKKFTHINGKKVSLEKATLEEDGSININGERIYSQR